MSSRARSAPWPVLVLEVPTAIADEVAGVLAASSLGAELEPSGREVTRVRVFLRGAGELSEILRRAAETLVGFGLEPEHCRLRTEVVEDEDWLQRYRALLRPIPLGRGFIVRTPGSPDGRDGRSPILLTPGRAFGTGEHATTQLCVEQLERRVEPGSRWLDLGCGTAILSIVARRCGADQVVAVDHDEDAVTVASEVLEANDLRGAVQLFRGSLERVEGGDGFDGIVANIHAPFFLERADGIAALLRGGGWLIVSGILVEDVAEIEGALVEAGLNPVDRGDEAPWAVWIGRRDGWSA